MLLCLFFFFNDTATTEIYTLSLHDALPICDVAAGSVEARHEAALDEVIGQNEHDGDRCRGRFGCPDSKAIADDCHHLTLDQDRKSTRLNSSHANISYAVFCLKKKKHIHK